MREEKKRKRVEGISREREDNDHSLKVQERLPVCG
jgi:hypothetical protein